MTQGTPQRTNTLGIVGFVFAILGVFSLGLLAPIALLICFIALFKRPRGFAVAGFFISLFATVAIGIVTAIFGWAIFSMVRYGKPYIATMATIESFHTRVDSYAATNRVLPDDATGQAMLDGKLDGWSHPLKYARLNDYSFQINSAGPDGMWGTQDDAIMNYDKKY